MANNGSDSGVVPAIDTATPQEPEEKPFNPLDMLLAAAQQTAEEEPEQDEFGKLPVTEEEYMAAQGTPTPTQQNAIDVYLHPYKTNGTLYSPSQQINHALRTDTPVPAMYQSAVDGMDSLMHDLGYNLNLTRYDRIGFMKRLLGGVTHEGMSEQQLKSKLIGMTYQDPAFVSTSHNNFVNAPPGNPFTDKTVEVRIKAKAGTKAMMPGNGAGGKLGEIVLGRNQVFKITDVKTPAGQYGRSGDKWYQKVIIEVEVG